MRLDLRNTYLYKLRDRLLGRLFSITDHGYANQIIYKEKPFVRNASIDITGNKNLINVQSDCLFTNLKIIIRGDNNRIIFGEGVRFNRSGEIWIVGNNCVLELHASTGIESAHFAVTEDYSKLIVNKNCMISTEVEIRTGDSHKILDITTKERINHARDVIIGERVWIGSGVTILKGVHIADGVILGARSLITKSVYEQNCIVAGIPAKVIRSQVTWEK
jgi:acetyltransferase-like isoleucine patch superfamily enzyme